MTALSNPQRRNLAMAIIRYRSRVGGLGMLVNHNHCAIIKRSPELKALLKKEAGGSGAPSGLGPRPPDLSGACRRHYAGDCARLPGVR